MKDSDRKESLAVQIALLERERDQAVEQEFKEEPYSPWERSWQEIRHAVHKRYAPELRRLREEYKKFSHD